MANYLVKKGVEYLADRAGLKIPEPVRAALDPVGYAVKEFAPPVERAVGAAPGTVEAAVDPKGFARNLAKEVGKDYLSDRGEIPVEDRSFSSSGGGGGKPRFDEESLSVEAFKRGGKVKAKPARRIDGIAQRGKTRGRYL